MKRITRRMAIKLKCLDCCCGQAKEVKLCPAKNCPLFPYRLGREDMGVYTDIPDGIAVKNDAHARDFEAENE